MPVTGRKLFSTEPPKRYFSVSNVSQQPPPPRSSALISTACPRSHIFPGRLFVPLGHRLPPIAGGANRRFLPRELTLFSLRCFINAWVSRNHRTIKGSRRVSRYGCASPAHAGASAHWNFGREIPLWRRTKATRRGNSLRFKAPCARIFSTLVLFETGKKATAGESEKKGKEDVRLNRETKERRGWRCFVPRNCDTYGGVKGFLCSSREPRVWIAPPRCTVHAFFLNWRTTRIDAANETNNPRDKLEHVPPGTSALLYPLPSVPSRVWLI